MLLTVADNCRRRQMLELESRPDETDAVPRSHLGMTDLPGSNAAGQTHQQQKQTQIAGVHTPACSLRAGGLRSPPVPRGWVVLAASRQWHAIRLMFPGASHPPI